MSAEAERSISELISSKEHDQESQSGENSSASADAQSAEGSSRSVKPSEEFSLTAQLQPCDEQDFQPDPSDNGRTTNSWQSNQDSSQPSDNPIEPVTEVSPPEEDQTSHQPNSGRGSQPFETEVPVQEPPWDPSSYPADDPRQWQGHIGEQNTFGEHNGNIDLEHGVRRELRCVTCKQKQASCFCFHCCICRLRFTSCTCNRTETRRVRIDRDSCFWKSITRKQQDTILLGGNTGNLLILANPLTFIATHLSSFRIGRSIGNTWGRVTRYFKNFQERKRKVKRARNIERFRQIVGGPKDSFTNDYTYVTKPEHVVDMLNELCTIPFIENESAMPFLGMDIEAYRIGRGSPLSYLQIGDYYHDKLYLIDLLTLQDDAWNVTGSNGIGLQALLEDENVRKMFLDPRMDAAVLFGQRKVRLQGVLDLAYVELIYKGNLNSCYRAGLAQMIRTYGSLTLEEYMEWYRIKSDPNNWGRWNERPTTAGAKLYAIGDVTYLHKVFQGIAGLLTADGLSLAYRSTAKAIEESWCDEADYWPQADKDFLDALTNMTNTNGRDHLAVLPASWPQSCIDAYRAAVVMERRLQEQKDTYEQDLDTIARRVRNGERLERVLRTPA